MKRYAGTLLTAVLFLYSNAYAATLYRDTVACTNTYSIANRTCTGSDGSSYTTNATAIAAMVAGDTILVRAGTYDDRISFVNRTGSSGARRTFKAYPGETVTFRSTTTSSYGLLLSSSTYITIQDLTIDGVNSITPQSNRIEGDSTNEILIENVVFKNWIDGNGLYIDSGSNITLRRTTYQDNGDYTTCADGKRQYGLYVHDGTNVVIENSVFIGNASAGIHLYPGPFTGVTVRRNDIHGNSRCSQVVIGGMIVAADSSGGNITGVKIYENIIYSNPGNTSQGNGGGIRLYASGGRTQVGTEIYRNTIYNNLNNTGDAYGINVQAGPSGTIIKNNHVVANGSGQILNAGTGTVQSGNRTTGTLTDCTVSTTNFTQKAGSACAGAGVADGLPVNSSVPDIGAFQTFGFAFCEVPVSAPNTIQVTFTSNVGGLGDVLTTFTARANTVNNPLSGSASKIGDTIISLPVSSGYLPGDSADISWSSGGLTDAIGIGGTLHQPFLQTLTNQSCTNNSGGAGTHVFTLETYEFHGVHGPEATTDIRGAENVANYEVVRGGAFRVRVAVKCSVSDCPPTGFYPYYSTDGVNYIIIPNVFDSGNIGFCGSYYTNIGVEDRTITTNQLSTAGTFVPGGVLLYAVAIPTISGLNVGYKTELEYCIALDDDATGVLYIQLRQQNGGSVAASVTPKITVINPMGSGF